MPYIYQCIIYGTNNKYIYGKLYLIFSIFFYFHVFDAGKPVWLPSLKKKWILKGNFPFLVDLFLGGDIWFIPWSCLSACLVVMDWTLGLFLCRQALQRRWCRLGQQQELFITRPRQSSHEIKYCKYQLYCLLKYRAQTQVEVKKIYIYNININLVET